MMPRTTEQIMKDFDGLACRLSPENLCCDGELNKRQVQHRFNQIRKEWKKLEKEIGRNVTEDEVWDYTLKQLRKGK